MISAYRELQSTFNRAEIQTETHYCRADISTPRRGLMRSTMVRSAVATCWDRSGSDGPPAEFLGQHAHAGSGFRTQHGTRGKAVPGNQGEAGCMLLERRDEHTRILGLVRARMIRRLAASRSKTPRPRHIDLP
jgi:hypothetical protein